MKLRKLNRSDIPAVIQLEKHHTPDKPYYSRYTKKDLDFIFDNPKTCQAIGLFDGDKLIGWGSYRTNWHRHNKEKGVFEIGSVVVNKNYRRKGLGNKILNKIISDLKKRNAKKMFIVVSPLNIGALLLYLKNGFVIYNFKKNVYGKGADRVYLKLEE